MEMHMGKWFCTHVNSSTGLGETEATLTHQTLGSQCGKERLGLGEKEEVERATF